MNGIKLDMIKEIPKGGIMSTAAKIKLNINTRQFIKELGKKGNLLQIAAAEAVNESAEEIDQEYQKRLKKKWSRKPLI